MPMWNWNKRWKREDNPGTEREDRYASSEDQTRNHKKAAIALDNYKKKYEELSAKMRNEMVEGRLTSTQREITKLYDQTYEKIVELCGFASTELTELEREMPYWMDSKKEKGKIVGMASLASLVLAAFLSLRITGNVIGLSPINPDSAVLMIIGILLGIIWFFVRKR